MHITDSRNYSSTNVVHHSDAISGTVMRNVNDIIITTAMWPWTLCMVTMTKIHDIGKECRFSANMQLDRLLHFCILINFV